MADFITTVTNAFGLFGSDTVTALILFFSGFLLDHIIMSAVIASASMPGFNLEKVKRFFNSFFFKPPR